MPESPAAALLSHHFGPSAVVSTFALPEDYSPSPSERTGVCVGWTVRSTAAVPGLVPWPVLVRPVPETGTYLVSYRQVSEECTLLDLPTAVGRLIDMARGGAYWGLLRPRGARGARGRPRT